MKKYYGDEGARNYARKFYSSKTWTLRSKAYRERHPYCEMCLERYKQGKIEFDEVNPVTCVHHKIHINKENYKDYRILLNESNLIGLCDQCHAKQHSKQRLYFDFNEDGSLISDYELE